jgi:phosphate ABC transporter phosphate-binding protein
MRAVRTGRSRAIQGLIAASLMTLAVLAPSLPAAAGGYVPISGAGSTWSQNAINQWIADVQQYGMQVNYAGTGSSDGRSEFLQGTVDFAASDIPFQSHPTDGSQAEDPAAGSYAYIPITAGGTAFMYNLTINGQRVTNLRLSGKNIARIFAGEVTNWNDASIAADNPQLTLPSEAIVPVVRSDGSGSSFQFSAWMVSQFGGDWTSLCNKSGRAPACGPSSYWPTTGNMIAQNGDLGVAGYVAQGYAEGAIGYVNYSYALNAHFPVAKMLNTAGYYTEPTPFNVAVSLLQAQVDTTDVNDPSLYLTQKLNDVYTDTDPRTYPLSSYSYLILPTMLGGQFSSAKGKTLAQFSYYAMCQGQQESASLGYSPMPFNLVQDTFTQIRKIPGQAVASFDLGACKNPTIDPNNPNDSNYLATKAPQPAACDKQGSTQCATGTAGDTNPTTLNGGSSSGGSSGAGSGGSTGAAAGSGGSTSSGGGVSSSGGATGGTVAGSGARAPSGASKTTGAQTSRGAVAGSTATPGSSPAATVCDPSSGNCAGGDASSGGSAASGLDSAGSGNSSNSLSDAGSAPVASAAGVTTTVAAKRGWTGVIMAVLIALLVLGLVVAPGVTTVMLRRARE